MESFENSQNNKEKYGIDASFLGEDETGKFVAVPVESTGEYLEDQGSIEEDIMFEKKYNIRMTSRVSSFPVKDGDKVIIFKLYYQ